MKRLLTIFLLILTCSACTPEEVRFWAWYHAGQPAEDSPGWDCHTMGNGLCGPPTPSDGFRCLDSTIPGESYCFDTYPAPEGCFLDDGTGICLWQEGRP